MKSPKRSGAGRIAAIVTSVVVLVLGLGLLAQCEPRVTLKQSASYQVYFPIMLKTNRPRLGIAASGNGGADAVRLTRADFYLNWWHYPSIATSAEFVPMIHTPPYPFPDAIANSEYVMGTNEPNVPS